MGVKLRRQLGQQEMISLVEGLTLGKADGRGGEKGARCRL